MAVPLPDARSLSDDVLEALRWRALRGCDLGFTEGDVADLLGVARETVSQWWTAYRRAVAALILQQCGVRLALRTVGAYLQRWGYTAQRPARHSRHQDPDEVDQWLTETYPELSTRAQQEHADLYFCDEMGLDLDTFSGNGYAHPGEPPLKEVDGGHTRVSAVSAINNRGDAHFLTFTGTLDAPVFIAF